MTLPDFNQGSPSKRRTRRLAVAVGAVVLAIVVVGIVVALVAG